MLRIGLGSIRGGIRIWTARQPCLERWQQGKSRKQIALMQEGISFLLLGSDSNLESLIQHPRKVENWTYDPGLRSTGFSSVVSKPNKREAS